MNRITHSSVRNNKINFEINIGIVKPTGFETQVLLLVQAITNSGEERRREASGFSAGKKIPSIA